ncbi:DUF7681 family protein [Phyllobacterium leguminum]|uniref:Acb2/Tad1 hairpin domain-containing protein n=1 Tax=Phyllobacterium leguminum TaxID=314237 RepID=A0A318T192_9HYPH|nr:cyclic nucleotide-binding protein [Phyllobacterium leguminum]PYE87508.1 hypothetical protein C7477_1129 [Phyllobacterium leguminum]
MPKHEGLPIPGYQPQTDGAIQLVKANKELEEHLLRLLDAFQTNDDIDKRWLAIGRTHIEQGFMAINRAVFRPTRIDCE